MTEPPQFLRDGTKVDPAAIVSGIRAGDVAAQAELYTVLHGPLGLYLQGKVGAQDVQDRLHEVFLIVVSAIQSGELRNPERLMGYVRTVVHRQAFESIRFQTKSRNRHVELDKPLENQPSLQLFDRKLNPEQTTLQSERASAIRIGMNALTPFHRDLLVRVLDGQSPERIQGEMKLGKRWYHSAKSRAMQELVVAAKRLLAGEPAPKYRHRSRNTSRSSRNKKIRDENIKSTT